LSSTFLTIERRESDEVDAAWHDPDVPSRGAGRQCSAKVLRIDDRSCGSSRSYPRSDDAKVNSEAPVQRLGGAAEQIASPKIDDDWAIAYGAGSEVRGNAPVRDVDEGWFNSVDRLS
jgi:hypothetical protein